MKTEIELYRPNLLKNWNFNQNNFKLDDDGVTLIPIWSQVNGSLDGWELINGQAVYTSGATNASFYQDDILTPGLTYSVTLQIPVLTGGFYAIFVYLGTTPIGVINAPGNYTLTGLSDGTKLEIFSIANSVEIDWIQLTQSPSVVKLDLNDDVSIPTTYAVADIRDPSKRNSAFTRTTTLPGTANNNKIFNEIFEIDGDCNYNPNKKVKVVYSYDGEEQLNGYLQIKSINRIQNGFNNYDLIGYEVVIIGGVNDLFSDMGTIMLADLGYTEYNHNYTVNTQEFSWNYGVYKNGVLTQTFIDGLSKPTDMVQISGDGRAQFNFTVPHGFAVNDQIYINLSDTTAKGYNGDHRVFSVPSSTSIVIWFPYIPGTGVLAGPTGDFIFKHEATGDGYVYPMIYYGAHPIAPTAMDGTNWRVSDFIPGIYIKTYLTKIAQRFGYTFVSDFFSTPNFNRLVMLSTLKEFKTSNAQLNHRAFQATKTVPITKHYELWFGGTSTNTYLVNVGTPVPSTGVVVIDTYSMVFEDDSTLPNFDNSNDYDNVLGYWTPSVTGTYTLSTAIHYAQVVTCSVSPYTILPQPSALFDDRMHFTIYIRDLTTSTDISTNTFLYDLPNNQNFNFIKNITTPEFVATAGHNYAVVIDVQQVDGSYINSPTAHSSSDRVYIDYEIQAGSLFFNTPKAVTYTDGEEVDLVSAIPKMSCKDFMINIIKMFNLYIQQDKENEKLLVIEPRNDYYNSTVVEDWILDTSEEVLLQPMAELNAKKYEFKFKTDNAYLNIDHVKNNDFGYGDKIIEVDNDFLTTTNTTELTISSGVLTEFPLGSNRIITGIFSQEAGVDNRVDANPRILYFGLASSYGSSLPTWNHTSTLSGQTINGKYVYPYAGHLDKVRGPKYDFNFGFPGTKYFTSNQWTSGNLYNIYYRDMITELTSPNNKLITANIYLKNSDISKLSFRSKYLIDGYYLRLNKIIDFVPGSSESTKCEFTKIENQIQFVPSYMRTDAVSAEFGQDTLDGDKLPVTSTLIERVNYVNPTINDFGFNNTINKIGCTSIQINGSNNTIGSFCSNINIIDSDNVFVYGGLSNVTVIGTSNVIITQSNTSVINGVTINSNGAIINTNINKINAGRDIVLNPFNTASIINKINAGKDSVLNLGSNTLINKINGGSNKIV